MTSVLSAGIYVGESVPLIVYGIVKVEKFMISAELSGLRLEAITTKVHASGTYKKKVKGTAQHNLFMCH